MEAQRKLDLPSSKNDSSLPFLLDTSLLQQTIQPLVLLLKFSILR